MRRRQSQNLTDVDSMSIHRRRSRCACVIGTRPEVIKMAPVIRQLRMTDWAMPFVITTGQQDGLLEQALSDFQLRPDWAIPHDSNSAHIIPVLTSIISKLDEILAQTSPAVMVAQGDTTTVLAASLAAFYRRVPFVHIEAGLRTGDVSAPFPEEFHRRAIAVSTLLHCAPTRSCRGAFATRERSRKQHPGFRQHRNRCVVGDGGH